MTTTGTYFASGSNHPGEILGFADCGHPVGVAIHELRGNALEVLTEIVDVPIFVDSGAFSEVVFDPAPRIAKFIDHAEWCRRLDAMEKIARAAGPRAYVVAPDCVAHQAETLDRLERYAHRVRAMARAGANILVPIQKGTIPMVEFWRLAREILAVPLERLVASIPMKKDATTAAELRVFLEAAQPSRVHLLGLGPKRDTFEEIVEVCGAAAPRAELSFDSVAIAAMVGRTNGVGGGPRELTRAQDHAAEVTAERLFFEGVDGLDYTDAIECPSEWATRAALKRFADELELNRAERRALYRDPDGWLETDDRYLEPLVEFALDRMWADFVTKKGSVTWRKRAAIREIFDDSTSLPDTPPTCDAPARSLSRSPAASSDGAATPPSPTCAGGSSSTQALAARSRSRSSTSSAARSSS